MLSLKAYKETPVGTQCSDRGKNTVGILLLCLDLLEQAQQSGCAAHDSSEAQEEQGDGLTDEDGQVAVGDFQSLTNLQLEGGAQNEGQDDGSGGDALLLNQEGNNTGNQHDPDVEHGVGVRIQVRFRLLPKLFWPILS